MKKIVLFVLLGLFTSSVVAEEREVKSVSSFTDALSVPSGTVLHGYDYHRKAQNIIARVCDLTTVVVWEKTNTDKIFWVCEKA